MLLMELNPESGFLTHPWQWRWWWWITTHYTRMTELRTQWHIFHNSVNVDNQIKRVHGEFHSTCHVMHSVCVFIFWRERDSINCWTRKCGCRVGSFIYRPQKDSSRDWSKDKCHKIFRKLTSSTIPFMFFQELCSSLLLGMKNLRYSPWKDCSKIFYCNINPIKIQISFQS